MKLKKILWVIFFLVLILLSIAYYLYNKPHKNIAASRPDFELTTDSLFSAFNEDETAANAKYLEKVIVVSGNIDHTAFDNPEAPIVILSTNSGAGTVTCGFEASLLESLKKLKDGDPIKIKGQCKGMTGDASLDLLAFPDIVLTKCTVFED